MFVKLRLAGQSMMRCVALNGIGNSSGEEMNNFESPIFEAKK